MSASGATSTNGRAAKRASWFVPIESKLHVPSPRPGVVPRRGLVKRLQAAQESSLVVIVGPPGYGKTTLLSQWAQADERPFAWVSLDDEDNDEARLLTYLAFALEEVAPLDPPVPRSRELGPAFTALALPRLTQALARRANPFVLVIDDVHVLRERKALDLLHIVGQNLPSGCQLVLSGRQLPPVPLSRFLAEDSLVTLDTTQLALTSREGAHLLHAAGLPLGPSEVEILVERTEGWAAALYLAALATREARHLGVALNEFPSHDGLLATYVKDVVFDELPTDCAEFMLGTAALDRMCGGLCDAVLGTEGSAERLAELERANLFVMSTNNERTWFRKHRLFADLLLAELRRRDPDGELVQHRRAAEWFDANDDPDAAIEHALGARDDHLAAEIIARNFAVYLTTGRALTARRWIESLPRTVVEDVPRMGSAAALTYAWSGDSERATHWLMVAERGDGQTSSSPDVRSSRKSPLAIARAALAPDGAFQLLADTTAGHRHELDQEASDWRPFCVFLQGVAHHARGDIDDARRMFHEAAILSVVGQPSVHAWSLAHIAVCDVAEDDWESACRYAERARTEVEHNDLHDCACAATVFATSSLTRAHSREPADARRDAARAAHHLEKLPSPPPWLSVPCRLLLAHTYLLLGDPASARETLPAARRDLARLSEAPLVRRWFEEVSDTASTQRQIATGPPLTAAEIRVLQFLPTHLSFREIADRLHVSRNTVKTQVMSSYRKLGATSRTEAVESAMALSIIGA